MSNSYACALLVKDDLVYYCQSKKNPNQWSFPIADETNDILGEMKPFDDFSEFDLNEMPNNGDVVMILGQYINCLEELRKDNVHMYSGWWYWNIDGDVNSHEIRTYIPTKYKK